MRTSHPATRPLILTAAGVLLAALAGAVVFVWKIGPVVLVLTRTHGVHSGDVLAVPLALVAAACWLAASHSLPQRPVHGEANTRVMASHVES